MNKEEIYDAKISPLMTQIIEVCRESKIAMLASFAIPHEDDEGLMCSTHLPDETGKLPPELAAAAGELRGGGAPPMMITTEHADGSKTLTAVIG
jgi:hypothetical protein